MGEEYSVPNSLTRRSRLFASRSIRGTWLLVSAVSGFCNGSDRSDRTTYNLPTLESVDIRTTSLSRPSTTRYISRQLSISQQRREGTNQHK